MTGLDKSAIRPAVIGGVLGLVLGCLLGWLAIGWWLWPVQYTGDVYTYELNDAEKMQYVAAVADSYNLNRQVEIARQRFNAWRPDEIVEALARLYVEYRADGREQEASQVMELTKRLKLLTNWDPTLVNQGIRQVENRYAEQGDPQKTSYLSQFANELTIAAPSVGQSGAAPAAPTAAPPQAVPTASVEEGTGFPLWVVFLIALVLAALGAALYARRYGLPSRPAIPASTPEPEEEYVGEGPRPALVAKSTYRLGMDNFDESFTIEGPDGSFRGECGFGISEAAGDESPKRVLAFDVWLFDKSDIRTLTKVLVSGYAYHNEAMRNKLSARGETVLAEPNATLILETGSLSVQARVLDMAYSDSPPPNSCFDHVTVQLTAHIKEALPTEELPEPAAPTGSEQPEQPENEPTEGSPVPMPPAA